MAFRINRKSISEQLVEHFRKQIESGKYKPGDEFPSERALEQQLGISRKTIGKVVSVLAGMGYLFKEQGKTTFVADFRNNRAAFPGDRNFGILFPTPSCVYHPAAAPVFLALCDALRAADCGMNLIFCKGMSDETLESQFRLRNVSGCFVFDYSRDFPRLGALEKIPAVCLCSGEETLSPSFSYIGADVVGACGDAAGLLAGSGRKRIAFLFGLEEWECDRKRIARFRETVEDTGGVFDPALLAPSGYDRGKTLQGLEKVLAGKPDALICADDMVASWAMTELARRSIEIPRQMAVVGFNDMTMYSLRCRPELTTFAIPAVEIARQAVEEMTRRTASPGSAPARRLVPMPLVRRASH
ncbi:MAG: substrate-binding domain-containing protein [Lentisphaeria bacterium]|nr:substrate-binding domain-containing protein [Lentisphaeria bacterium]